MCISQVSRAFLLVHIVHITRRRMMIASADSAVSRAMKLGSGLNFIKQKILLSKFVC